MRPLILLLILTVFCACSNEPVNKFGFATLEQEVEEQPTNANVSELIRAYNEWLDENPEASDDRKEVLQRMINVSDRHIRLNAKLNALQNLILEFPSEMTGERILEVGRTYDQMNKDIARKIINQSFLKKWPTHPQADSLRQAIGTDIEPADSLIADLGATMFDESVLRLNTQIARRFVDACEAYALVNPDQPQTIEYLRQAAETSRTLGALERALDIYDWIIMKYPEHRRAPQALFLKAFTYDNDMGDTANARKYYTEFLEKYPQDTFAVSAEFLLKHLGKDDNELLEVLQQGEGN